MEKELDTTELIVENRTEIDGDFGDEDYFFRREYSIYLLRLKMIFSNITEK